jgi:hypothetical protein
VIYGDGGTHVPSPEARVDKLAASLSAAGFSPHVKDHKNCACIEIDMAVPDSLSAESWRELLALLDTADWFGLTDSTTSGRTVWAAISKEARATAGAVRGHGSQP